MNQSFDYDYCNPAPSSNSLLIQATSPAASYSEYQLSAPSAATHAAITNSYVRQIRASQAPSSFRSAFNTSAVYHDVYRKELRCKGHATCWWGSQRSCMTAWRFLRHTDYDVSGDNTKRTIRAERAEWRCRVMPRTYKEFAKC